MQHFSYTLIPEVFHSFETGETFKKCFMCETDLMVEGTNYLIEKAFNQKEVIFEYAICSDCRESLNNELSSKSKKLIANYFDEHIDFDAHREAMLKKYGHDVDGWISHCLVKGTPIRECKEYQIYAHCIDEDILFTGMPYALSSETMDDLLQLLSDESLGVIGEFSKKLFDLDIPSPVLVL